MSERPPRENPPRDFEAVKPEIVQQIETLDLDPKRKGDVLLVAMGIKPAALIGFDANALPVEDPNIPTIERTIRNLHKISRESGLPFKMLPRKIERAPEDRVEILIGTNDETLEKLSKALESKDHTLIGRALGIPETAIEAFIRKRERLDLHTVPKDILTSEAFLFSPTLTLSMNNWQNEIQEGARRAKAIRSISPRIYQEMAQGALRYYKRHGYIIREKP